MGEVLVGLWGDIDNENAMIAALNHFDPQIPRVRCDVSIDDLFDARDCRIDVPNAVHVSDHITIKLVPRCREPDDNDAARR